MIKIKYDMKQVIGVLFGSFILIAFCLLFLLFDTRDISDDSPFNNPIIYYLCKGFVLFSALFFTFGVVFIIKNVIKYKDNVIEIYDDYMIDRSTYNSLGKIEYKDIEKIYTKGAYICIELKNEEEYLKNIKELKKFLINSNRKMKYTAISLSDNLLKIGRSELKKLIEEKVQQVNTI